MIERVFLSMPAWAAFSGRGGIVRDRIRQRRLKKRGALPVYDLPPDGKLAYDEHLSRLGLSAGEPLLVISARNLGNNLRIIAYRRGEALMQLLGEGAETGRRPYWCLCCVDGGRLEAHRLRFDADAIGEIDGRTGNRGRAGRIQWALSGQPLLWDGRFRSNDVLLNTYDLRHIYNTETGQGRHGARSQEGHNAADLITTLVRTDSAAAVRQKAGQLGLRPERHYFHSAIGLDRRGDVVLVQCHGSFRRVAETLRAAGAAHAIELDEGGSVSAHLVYQPREGTQLQDHRILASHYFRPRASALLVFKLRAEQSPRGLYLPVKEDADLGR
jgi:hypothetical protein